MTLQINFLCPYSPLICTRAIWSIKCTATDSFWWRKYGSSPIMTFEFTAQSLIMQTLLRLMSLFMPKSPRWCHESHTHAVMQPAVYCSLHPAAPAALSSVPHPLWVSAQGTTRVSSPIRSGLACCHPFPGRSASVHWCLSDAWPSLPEVRCPTVAGQPWYKEMRPGATRRERRPCFMNATVACISNELPK